MNLCLGVERARVVVLILIILCLIILVVWVDNAMLPLHLIWFLCSIILYRVLLSTHPKYHFICVLMLSTGVMGWRIPIDAYRNDSLLRPLSMLNSLITGIGLVLTAWYDSNWNVLVGLLLSYLLLLLLFLCLLFALHDDELISRYPFTNQVKMQPDQINQQYSKHPNQKRINPHSHHRPQILFPLIFGPQ